MQVARFPLLQTRQLDRLVVDYLKQDQSLSSLIADFPKLESFKNQMDNCSFSKEKRNVLVSSINRQNKTLQLSSLTSQNIDSLLKNNSYSVTTGHQLNLFTGPTYFVFKILSCVKLTLQLKDRFPDQHFVPVYWMAAEDHDFEEVNHTYLYGKKVEWDSTQRGAVGNLNLGGVELAVQQFGELIGNTQEAANCAALMATAYSKSSLADATRYLVNELFGKYGLVILDGNDHELKQLFIPIMSDELLHQSSFKTTNETSSQLQELGYKTQVNPRAINLFYLQQNARNRIEKTDDNGWKVIDSNREWNRDELIEELENQPENFSPNVVMRPIYQEVVLPNLAYIGGPGELAYWLQLKSTFDHHRVAFPLLVLRDSALLISEKTNQRFIKIGLRVEDVFEDKNVLIKKLVNADEVTLDEEKNKLNELFISIKEKAKSADATLEGAANAELQKQITSLDTFEKRIVKALKVKEEVKLNQLDKLLNEVLPNGALNERRDNYFQYQVEFGEGLMDELLRAFNPLNGELKIVYQN